MGSQAHALYERALAIQEKARGPDHPEVAIILNNLAELHLTMRRPQDAIPLLERALVIYTTFEGIQHGEMDAQLNLATALIASHGDRVRALALAGQARAGFRETGDIRKLAEVEQFLAEQVGQ
jgi:tetratricopeptide (TPR) repeat protein